jgi:DNA-binding PadR family transcriptional regulator
MAMAELQRRSTLAMAVLSLLAEAPMHPYRMQQVIRQRGKDRVVNVGQRASLYKTIERLQKVGLVAVRETQRDQNWPERTVYELTEAGRDVLLGWMRGALAEPEREFPEFPAALSFMALLSPDDVLSQLERREVWLRADVAELDAELAAVPVPRLFLVEDEYRLAQRRAELTWVEALVEDLRAGRLTWTEAWIRQFAALAEQP